MVYPALTESNSGLLDTGSDVGLSAFNVERKLTFLKLANQYWPDMSRCCREIGIHITTFYNHYKRDVKFCEEVKAIKAAKLDEIERVSIESARDQRKGFLDRAMILRAHRPELYDRAKVVKIEGYKMTAGEKQTRLGAVETVLDAEISKAYLDRKERREERKRKQISARSESASEAGAGGAK